MRSILCNVDPALDPLFIAYNTGAGGRILHTICIVRKYFTQETASNPVFGSFPVKNYSKERFKEWLRVNFCRRAAGTPGSPQLFGSWNGEI